MIQDERSLLLKDLSSRQPHGVKVQVNQQGLQEYDDYWKNWDLNKETQEVSGVLKYGVTLDCMAMVDGVIPFEFIKPYLFPLSSMTEEQRKKYESLCETSYTCHYECGPIVYNTKFHDTVKSIDYLIENYFDYRGLIPMDLALDATGLNLY
jgi:hypothetical protein